MGVSTSQKRVAIIGGGLTGVVSCWALQRSGLDVHLFETDSELGGHMKAWPLECNGNQVPVDRELPTFNAAACPNLISLLHHLGISSSVIPFSFGVDDGTSVFKWHASILKSILAKPRMLCKLETYRLLVDAIYLRGHGSDVEDADILKSTEAYLSEKGYSNSFRDKYLAPLLSTLWRTNAGRFLRNLPIGALVHSLSNHQLFATNGTWSHWWRIDPGVRYLIDAMSKDFPTEKQHLVTKVHEVTRSRKPQIRYTLATSSGEYSGFDHVIMAIDGQEALRLLGSSVTDEEDDILQCLGVTKNRAVLHSNPNNTINNNLPGHNSFLEYGNHSRQDESTRSCQEYNINLLEDIPVSRFGNVFITLNAVAPLPVNDVREVWEFTEPEPSTHSLMAQSRLASIQNTRGLSYGFFWTGRGPLEDSITSGLRMATQDLGATVPFRVLFHPHPLRSTGLPNRRPGIRRNLLKTILEALRALLLFLELLSILLDFTPAPGLNIQTRLNLLWGHRAPVVMAHNKQI